jgi:hypothetical protein
MMARNQKSKVDALLEEIDRLSAEELAALRSRPEEVLAGAEPRKPRKRHSIMELEGLGAEFWRSIDVDAYLEQERNSWR